MSEWVGGWVEGEGVEVSVRAYIFQKESAGNRPRLSSPPPSLPRPLHFHQTANPFNLPPPPCPVHTQTHVGVQRFALLRHWFLLHCPGLPASSLVCNTVVILDNIKNKTKKHRTPTQIPENTLPHKQKQSTKYRLLFPSSRALKHELLKTRWRI